MRTTATRGCERSPRQARADIGRRRLLVAMGWLPLAVPAAWALAGCSGEETPSPGAGAGRGRAEPPAPPPKPAEKPPTEPPQKAGSGGATGQQPAADALVTEVPAMKPTVQALQYVNESAKPDQNCANCQFYTAKGEARGSCQLFTQGLVTARGWCASWTRKIPT